MSDITVEFIPVHPIDEATRRFWENARNLNDLPAPVVTVSREDLARLYDICRKQEKKP
jgi:hypothetical protein